MKYLKVLLSTAVVLSLLACGGGNKTTADTSSPGSSVALFTSAPSTLSIPSGGAASMFTIGGGKSPYSVATSNAPVASVSVNGSSFGVIAGNAGTAQIVITDATGAKVTVDVTVTAPVAPALVTTAPSAITVPAGVTPGAVYKISGGVPPYSAASSNVGLVQANVSQTSLSISGIGVGTATVDVVDSVNTKVSIGVTVSTSTATSSSLNVFPAGASGTVSDDLNFTIAGGTPGYKITVNNPNIATISATSLSTSGSLLTVSLKNVGDTVVTVSDTLGQTTNFPISVGISSGQLRLSPATFLVGENETSPISLNIYGGTPPYRALTSDLTKSSVSVIGASFINGSGSSGNRCIAPVDDSGKYMRSGTYDVILTVIDSLGASATSTMTIKDNGGGIDPGTDPITNPGNISAGCPP